MQRTQRYLTQGLIPLVKLMDKTLKSESEESEEMFDLAMDSFNMFAFSHRDLSNQRRRLIGPAIAGKYKQLCSESAAISATQLFGSQETLEKSVKQIDESNKIGSKIHVNTQQKEKDRNNPSTSKSTGQRFSRDFRYSGQNNEKSSFYNYNDNFLSKKAQYQHQNKKTTHKKGELGHQRK